MKLHKKEPDQPYILIKCSNTKIFDKIIWKKIGYITDFKINEPIQLPTDKPYKYYRFERVTWEE